MSFEIYKLVKEFIENDFQKVEPTKPPKINGGKTKKNKKSKSTCYCRNPVLQLRKTEKEK